jgi:hypothetical protein
VPLWDRPPIDAISVSNSLFSSGTFRITGGPGVTVGSDASGASISAGYVGSFFENGVPGPGGTNSAAQDYGANMGSTLVNSNLAGGRLLLQPVSPSNELFPMNLSVTEADLNFSGGVTTSNASHSAAFTSTYFLGFYTRVNSTQLSIINSASRTLTGAAATANTSLFVGARYLSFHSSIFSSAPVFTEGGRYWFAQIIRTSGTLYTGTTVTGSANAMLNQLGFFQGMSIQRSGQWGAAAASNTSSNAWYPFMGVHSLTTHSSLPGSLAHSDINKASVNANFIPHLIFNGGLAPLA